MSGDQRNCPEDPTATGTDASSSDGSTDESDIDLGENEVFRLSPVDDPRELWRTGLVMVYSTDLTRWLRNAATSDRTLEKRVSTAEAMPNPPIQVLKHVRFVDDSGSLDNCYYELDIEAGPSAEEDKRTEETPSKTDAWYEISASPSQGSDDATYLVLPDLDQAVRSELETVGVGERTDEIVIKDPSESLAVVLNELAMTLTHLTIFRVDRETV